MPVTKKCYQLFLNLLCLNSKKPNVTNFLLPTQKNVPMIPTETDNVAKQIPLVPDPPSIIGTFFGIKTWKKIAGLNRNN
jgi:hypothetical protein